MKLKEAMLVIGFGFVGAGCGVTSCVARGSRVLTERTWVPIEDLKIGDEIISVCEETGRQESSEIVAIQKATREAGSVSVGERELLMTSDHPVYDPVEKKYAPAGDWFLGNRTMLAVIQSDGLQREVVTARSVFVSIVDVFDLTVASDLHNFVAEGILVHNKSIAQPTCTTANGERVGEGSVCEVAECAQARWLCTSDGPVCECLSEDVGVNDTGDVSDTSDVSEADDAGGDDVGGSEDVGSDVVDASSDASADSAD